MWSCVAVTRGGWGDVWGFGSRTEALAHPIVMEGDAVVESPRDTLSVWNYLILARMCGEVLGDREMEHRIRRDVLGQADTRIRDVRAAVAAEDVWSALRQAARVPPTDEAQIAAIVERDDRLHDEWRAREQSRRTSVTTTQTAAAPAAAAEAPKTLAGFSLKAKIAFGKDKEGKHYDTKDNNPKRAGSKSHELFGKYRSGMTVQEASDAGITAAALKWDSEHGFIVVG